MYIYTTGKGTQATLIYEGEKNSPNCCPLCGKLITHILPETEPGIHPAVCQYGHKLQLQDNAVCRENAC